MKRLYVLRHAKSDWADPALPDRDRPLADKGRKQVRRLQRLAPTLSVELVVCSPAARARATVEPLVPLLAGARMTIVDSVYDAGVSDLLDVVRGLPDDVSSVLLVGHMPGLAILVESLTGVWQDLPTGALATIEADVERWGDVAAEGAEPGRRPVARLVHVVTPKELRG